ncbi:MAG: ATP phosphoribosyltransferase regulatory subunit, partial [Tidjanibacter sp.]|nr:ATP phosphoribosyltransferase regulatory subunit [Tidjanibacter sp.]
GVKLKINNRKILFGIAETIGHADKMIDITVAIDKLDKIGLDNVKRELSERGIEEEAIEKLIPILSLSGTSREKLAKMAEIIGGSETGVKGIREMEQLFDYIEASDCGLEIEIDLSLARGLNYYTGAIFEVKAKDYEIGSICGGGRYDDLTGIFGLPNTSGVGISFGADRIYDVMTGLDLFPEEAGRTTDVMFINFGGTELGVALRLLGTLRKAGIPSDIYPESAKMKRQMEYANRRAIPYVVIVGESEIGSEVATVKNMTTGEQMSVPFAELATHLSRK